ncbi:Hypothetical predicted protein [Olea europaea subsp. europaea]|uniref:Uncharacterized protein n=1 Tax=Olea europaea subsp. europaea TaxID=158383 RepID=A0A8S0QKH2_OLEEU|nr:Hypothetical predicted protein [Olea europaea subsp. europaea]
MTPNRTKEHVLTKHPSNPRVGAKCLSGLSPKKWLEEQAQAGSKAHQRDGRCYHKYESHLPTKRRTAVNVDTVTNYDTNRMTQEAAIPVENSLANAPRGQASVFDRLGPARDREGWPSNPPAQTGQLLVSSNIPHLFNSFLEENQHEQPRPRTTNELVLRYMHPSPRKGGKDEPH